MTPILIVKTGSTIPELKSTHGDFEQWFEAGLQTSVSTVDVTQGEPLPDPTSVQQSFSGILVTGSPAMVSHQLPWSENTAAWLRATAQSTSEHPIPVLGVCYGHQLVAHAFGATVGPNPNGREIGTAQLDFCAQAADDPLLEQLDTGALVQTSHSEAVLGIPQGTQVLATTKLDQYHVLRFGEYQWGVQFHPEFDADIVSEYIRARAEPIADEGLSPTALLNAVQETAAGNQVLRNFAKICRRNSASKQN